MMLRRRRSISLSISISLTLVSALCGCGAAATGAGAADAAPGPVVTGRSDDVTPGSTAPPSVAADAGGGGDDASTRDASAVDAGSEDGAATGELIVKAFEDPAYGSTQWSYQRTTEYVGELPNDHMSSFQVAEGYTVVFFWDRDFARPMAYVRGATLPSELPAGLAEYARDCSTMRADDDNQMSSLRVYDPTGAEVK